MSSVSTESNPDRRHERDSSYLGVLDDPAWFLDRLDLKRGLGVFTRTRRQELSAAVFLDGRWDRRGTQQCAVSIDEISRFQSAAPPPVVIWHSAFCCSTLIANCLDWPGVSLALKEPMVLLDLVEAVRQAHEAADQRLISTTFSILGRGFAAGERLVIKPSNSANAMMPQAAGAAGPMLLLYSSCRDFILSIVSGGPFSGGGEDRRKFVRDLMAERVLLGKPGVRWRAEDLFVMTDLQIAALVWHAQMAEFRAMAGALGRRRVRSLDCEVFLADPRRGLDDLDNFLALGLGPARTDAIARGPKLARYAKRSGLAYNADGRRTALNAAAIALGSNLQAVLDWSYETCPETPRGDPVGSPLISLEA